MWDNRCKVAVSGVGYSKVTRSADIPLAAHALEAVKGAVADSGLQMADIDGLATYPELPATGHAEVDGISVVSVNCMMAMLKLPALTWHIQVGTTNIGGAVQQAANALLAGVCKYAVVWRAMHNPRGTYQNLPGALRVRRGAVHRAVRVRRPRTRHGGRLYALAGTAWTEPREDGDARGDAAKAHAAQSARVVLRHAAVPRGLLRIAHGRLSVLPVRLRHPGARRGRHRADHGGPGARSEASDRRISAGYGQRLHFEVAGRIGSLSSYMEGGSSSAKLTWERSGFSPKDVDVAQIYDGFSASVIYGLELYGFCKEGEALDFIQDGRIELDGELPLNTFGGSLGTGRIHGLWHIIEGALQASGRAGSRQVKDANVSFVGASAPIVTGTTFIFVREPY